MFPESWQRLWQRCRGERGGAGRQCSPPLWEPWVGWMGPRPPHPCRLSVVSGRGTGWEGSSGGSPGSGVRACSLAGPGPVSAPLRRLPRTIIGPMVLACPEVGITAATTFVAHTRGDPGPVSLPSGLPPSASLELGAWTEWVSLGTCCLRISSRLISRNLDWTKGRDQKPLKPRRCWASCPYGLVTSFGKRLHCFQRHPPRAPKG